MEHTLDIRAHNAIPARGGELLQWRVQAGAGVVDEDVERAESPADCLREARGSLGAGQISDEDLHLAYLAKAPRRRVELLLGARGDHEPGAGPREALGDHESDSPRSTRDEGGLSGNVEQGSRR